MLTSSNWCRLMLHETSATTNLHRFFASYYVRKVRSFSMDYPKVRQLENWKLNDSAAASQFHHGRSVVFVNREVLMKRSDNRRMSIDWVENRQLSAVLTEIGLSVDVAASSCLLDAVPLQTDSNDADDELMGVYGYGLKGVSDKHVELLEKTLVGRLTPVRAAMLSSHRSDAVFISQAQSLLQWSSTFRHCPKCTHKLTTLVSKSAATCEPCKKTFYPTLSPVAQCLIQNPEGTHCLLVRHKMSLPGMYTAVAGFLEPGESLEEAISREVAEELGIDVIKPVYLYRSQHWPFPNSSMMLPFIVIGDMNQQIDIDRKELRDAGWFSREQIAAAMDNIEQDKYQLDETNGNTKSDRFWLIPPEATTAHQLIRKWLNQ